MSGRFPGWSHLPPELLLLIVQDHLTSAIDIVRLRCVCVLWRSTVSADLIPSQLPWLLLPDHKRTPSLSFFSPSDRNLYTLTLPSSDWNCILTSSHGYLLLRKKKNPTPHGGISFSLFNPINNHLIPFPPLLSERESSFIHKAVIGLTPAPLVAILTYTKLCFCILGKPDWRVIDVEFSYVSTDQFDLAYHNGYFYLVTGSNLRVFNLKLSKKLSRGQRLDLPYWDVSSLHFVVSSGILLLLVGYCSERQECRFKVYRVDRSSKGIWSLVRKEVGGDDLFFVSRTNSVCVPAEAVSGWEATRGCYATEKWAEEGAMVAQIHLMMGGKDGFSLEWLPDQYYWHAPRAHWTDWKDVTRIAWFVPKLR